ncbi:GLUG motif-containing protein, partial [Propionivibrio dicarboxylicus]
MKRSMPFGLKTTAAALAAAWAGIAQANPANPVVLAGQATFQQVGKTLTVSNTPGAIINWQSFNIDRGELTRFIQQSASSQVLNRVTGVDPSVILGSLQSNGRVILINPNGVAFGAGAQVDVGGLLVSTLQLKDADFIAGKYKFGDTVGAGSIRNEGTIRTATGGSVILIAPKVENSGLIQTPEGQILLAAGKSVTIADPDRPTIQVEVTNSEHQAVNLGTLIGKEVSLYGGLVKNSGTIQATTAVVGQNGKIRLQAKNDVENTGTLQTSGPQGGDILIQAQTGAAVVQGVVDAKGIAAPAEIQAALKAMPSAVETGKGGRIEILAPTITVDATVDTSGSAGGGTILIGGNYQGGAKSVPTDWSQTAALKRASLSLSDPYAASPSVTETAETTVAYGSSNDPTQQTGSTGQNNPLIPNPALPRARSTTIGANARIRSDALDDGDGGVIVAWADDATTVAGSITARGGFSGGNGGLVETSGHTVSLSGLHIDTTAPLGKTGRWLIDPTDFTIAASGGDMTGSDLSNALASTDVEIQSAAGRSGTAGDINVNDAVSWNANQLTLTAAHDININAVMTASGTSSLVLNTAGSEVGGTVRVGFDASGNFAGRVDFPGRSGTGFLTVNGNGYTVINSLGVEGDTSGLTLQGIGGNASGYYALGSDIVASETSAWSGGFLPIGLSGGSFNGLGHKIDGLTIIRPEENFVGLFGMASGGEISNIGLTNLSITGIDYVGGLVGSNGGSIINSYAKGSLGGVDRVGGLVGSNTFGGSINTSYSTANVSGVDAVGGLVGVNYGGTVGASYATGDVSGSNGVGGLIGRITYYAEITNSYATGNVSGQRDVGGLVGFFGGNVGEIRNSHYNVDTATINGSHLVTLGGLYNGQFQDWLTHGLPLDIANYSTTLLSVGGYYEISSVQGMKDLLGFADISSYKFKLTSDISLASIPGYHVPAFLAQEFNGNGYVIYDLSINLPNDVVGLFGSTSSTSTICNLGVDGSVAGNAYAGGLVGVNRGAITNSYANVVLTGSDSMVGGLVGSNEGNIANSYATGVVTGFVGTGGLVGGNFGTISSSYSTGLVSGSYDVGGLVGHDFSGNINNSYWNTETSNQAGSAGGFGLTNAQMKSAASFAGFDFGSIWRISEGISPPSLRSFALNTWTGAADNQFWATAGNWSLGHVPTSAELVNIPTVAGADYVALTGNYTVRKITSDEPFALSSSGTSFTLNHGGDFNAGLTLGAGTTLTSNGRLSISSDPVLGANARINLGTLANLTINGNSYLLIRDATGLKNITPELGTNYYALADDIDASATSGWDSGQGFSPIREFSGTLNGLGHVIDRLTINRPGESMVGLIGEAGHLSRIANVGLTNVSVSGMDRVGGLVGVLSGQVTNSRVSGSVTGTGNYVGGLVGVNQSGNIINSTVSGTVTGTGNYVGGLVGLNQGWISGSSMNGVVLGSGASVGGLVGANVGDSDGGRGAITNSSASATVSGASQVGGLVGTIEGWGSESTIDSSYATSSVSGASLVGGLVGWQGSGGLVTNSHYNVDAGTINGGKSVTPGGLYNNQFQDWLTNGMTLNIANYSTSLPLVGGYYQIGDVQGMKDLLGFADQGGYKFKLVSDIDLSPINGYNIPVFSAQELNGGGNILSNLNVSLPNHNLGLIGVLSSGSTLNDIGVAGTVTGLFEVGGLVGRNEGTISASHASTVVNGLANSSDVGGLVGWNNGGTISNSYATGSISALSGSDSVGGLVGGNSGSITTSYASGAVSGSSNVGGLVGYATGVANYSYWDIEASGQSSSAGGTGLTTAQMKLGASFSGFDFDNVWQINEKVSTPTHVPPVVSNVWTGAADGVSWSLAGNWLLGHVPTSGEIASIPLGSGAGYVTLTGNYVVRRVTSDEPFSLVGTGTTFGLRWGGDFNAGLTLGAGTTLSSNGALNISSDPVLAQGAKIALGTLSSLSINGNSYTLLRDVNALQDMRNCTGCSYALADDIDASETRTWGYGGGFEPIRGFNGTFNGLGHTIDRLMTDRQYDWDAYTGLFSDSSGTISNVGLTNANVIGGYVVGALVGMNYGTISNSYATGSVVGNSNVGGLVGINSGTISNSYAAASVDGALEVGGLVGYNENGTISNSHYNIDAVSINGNSLVTLGGLYDSQYQDWFARGLSLDIANYSTTLPLSLDGYYQISNVQGMKDLLGFADQGSYKFKLTGNVDLSSAQGFNVPIFSAAEFDGGGYVVSNLNVMLPNSNVGLIGWLSPNSTVSNLGVSGNVTGQGNVGGLVGANQGTINASYSTATVTSLEGGGSVGGLVGFNRGSIGDSYAIGSVTGYNAVGGFVGDNFGGTINTSYSSGAVTCRVSYCGGFGGISTGSINNSYLDVEASGLGATNGVIGLTTVQMKQQSSFVGFDFNNVWRISEGVSAPTHLPPAVTNVWTGLGDGLRWIDANNWSLMHVPQADERVSIPWASNSSYVSLSGTYSVQRIVSDEPFSLTGSGTSFSLSSGGSFNAGLTLGVGTRLISNGALSISSDPVIGIGARIDLGAFASLSIANTPYVLVRDVTGLQAIQSDTGNSYALASDIDASDTINWENGGGFAPINFNGIFSGLGHTIDRLTINRPSQGPVGLFGFNSGVISDVGLSRASIVGGYSVGALVGENGGTIRNAYVADSTVIGDSCVGGLAGYNSGMISASYASASVAGTSELGGLVGLNDFLYGGSITNSHYDIDAVTINGNHRLTVGGLYADQYQDWLSHGLSLDIANYSATLSLSGEGYYQIGSVQGLKDLLGFADQSGYKFKLVSNLDLTDSPGLHIPSFSAAELSGGGYVVANLNVNLPNSNVGLIGWLSSASTVKDIGVSGNVSGMYEVGGLVGQNQGTIIDSHATTAVSGLAGGYDIGGLVGWNNGGTVSGGSASGVVTGGAGTRGVGGLVGWNSGAVSDSRSSGPVTGSTDVGGLIGYNDYQSGGTFINSHYDIDNVTLNGEHLVTLGGLYSTQYQDWLANGLTLDIANYASSLPASNGYYQINSVQGMKDLLGFADKSDYKFRLGNDIDLSTIPGYHVPAFSASEFNGDGHLISNLSVNLPNSNVGLIGWLAPGSTINGLGVGGSVSGLNGVGGLVGLNQGVITGSYSAVAVSGQDGGSYVGGMVGENAGVMSDSYATGAVTGGWSVGGLVGYNRGTIERSYSSGVVSGNGNVGGLVGDNALWAGGTVSRSYWDMDASGQTTSSGDDVIGLTSAQMKSAFSFDGFSFSDIWQVNEGVSSPTLRAFSTLSNIWTGAVDHQFWATAGNWSLGHVPTVSELVSIPDLANTSLITLSTGTYSAKTLTSAEAFSLLGNGTSFTLANGGTLSAGLTLGSGTTLTTNGALSVTGGFSLNNATVNGTGSLTVTDSFSRTGGTISNLSGVSLTQLSGNLAPGVLTSIAGPVTLKANAGALLLDSISAENITGTSGGGQSITLNSGASLNASLTGGNAIVLDAGTGGFVNNSGSATPFSIDASSRWLIYANDPASVSKNGITSDFRHYSDVSSSYAPEAVAESGNGFIYASAPGTLSVDTTLAGGAASHVYGNASTATLGYALRGFADDEDNAFNIGLSGSAAFTGLPGTASNVGSYGVAYSTGFGNVSGYAFAAGTPLSYSVTQRPISVTAEAQSKVYGNADPTLSYVVGGSGLVNGDTLSGALSRISGENVGAYAINQ